MLLKWLRAEFNYVNESSPEDYRVDCPFCVDQDTKQHLYIGISKPGVHCFRCDWHGTWFDLVKEISGADSYAEVWHMLKDPIPDITNYETVAERLAKAKHYVQESFDMPEWFVPFSKPNGNSLHRKLVLQYALKRMTETEIVRYGIGYCKDTSSMNAMRLIIPIERGYYQARSIHKNPAKKYINPMFHIEDRLFNYQALDNYETVGISEGAISAKAFGRNGVATLGKNGGTISQRKRLSKSKVREFVIAYDAGEERKEGVLDLADYLASSGKGVIIRKYLEGDPDSCTEFEEVIYSGLMYKIQSRFITNRKPVSVFR